jgi:hypothetical protein
MNDQKSTITSSYGRRENMTLNIILKAIFQFGLSMSSNHARRVSYTSCKPMIMFWMHFA